MPFLLIIATPFTLMLSNFGIHVTIKNVLFVSNKNVFLAEYFFFISLNLKSNNAKPKLVRREILFVF